MYADRVDNGTVVYWTMPTATDNSGLPVVITQTLGQSNNSRFEVGTYEIRYQGEDAAGNIQICSFDIIIERKRNT